MRRRILLESISDDQIVDLGLPNGTLWAKQNIGAEKETDYGLYFQWGDVSGYTSDQVGCETGKKGFKDEDYKYFDGDYTKYNQSDNLRVLQPSDDMATINIGSDWVVPSLNDFAELTANTTYEEATVNGVLCKKYTSKSNSSKYILFPCAGGVRNCEFWNIGVNCYYWTSTFYNYNDSYRYAYGLQDNALNGVSRFYGLPVRPIKYRINKTNRGIADGYEYVDLNLPSGLKWATCNVGATTETGYGKYYGFGVGSSSYTSTQTTYPGTTTFSSLPSSADTATQVMGTPWKMPTSGQCKELIDNTTYSRTTINGVSGGCFTSKVNSSAYLFIPFAGHYNGSLTGKGYNGAILSGTRQGYATGNNNIFAISFATNASISNFYQKETSTGQGYTIRGVHT